MGKVTNPEEIDDGWDSHYYQGYLEELIETYEFADLPAFWPTMTQLGNPSETLLELDQQFKDRIDNIEGLRVVRGSVIMTIFDNINGSNLIPDEDYDWVRPMIEEDPESFDIYCIYHVPKRMAFQAFEAVDDTENEYRVEGLFVIPE